jgi:two-component system nitrogen regulation response regulator NtrX
MRRPMVAEPGPLILIIDDDPDVRRPCASLLRSRGFLPLTAESVGEGLRVFAEKSPNAVILDLRLPDGTGIDVLRALQRQAPGIPVIVISGFGSVTDAVDAMRAGAVDFIEKPVAGERLFGILDRVLAPPLRAGEPDLGVAVDGARYGMIGTSATMRRIYQLVEMAAPTKCRVFITGESGTGKELIARAIHALSPRRDRPFIQMNCAAIPSELIESEMFGHVRGAFTGAISDRRGKFEMATSGTLFLDEIGDMSLMTQAKLLRVLEEGEVTPVGDGLSRPVDVRVLAATGKNLHAEIERGAFREDLYHRLNVLTIAVPPLRARREDIAELAEHFLRLASVENGVKPKRLAQRSTDFLTHLAWRGNVRELRNLMERLVVLVPTDTVSQRDVMEALQMADAGESVDAAALPLREARARFERQYILQRLSANRGNLGATAKDLGIERTNLYRKMKQLGIATSAAKSQRGALQT